MQAAVLKKEALAPIVHVQNVVPLTISLLTANKLRPFYKMIPRNTAYPTEKILYAKTAKENQTNAKIELYKGEQVLPGGNILIGHTVLGGIFIFLFIYLI